MNYWLTTHWPHRVDTEEDEPHFGVWVTSKKRHVISRVKPGDLVWVYETESGKTEIRRMADGTEERVPCRRGRGGIVALVKVTEMAYEPEGSQPQTYTDRSSMWWRYHAPTAPVNSAGFLRRQEVARLLGYSPAYVFRGFGEDHSGLGHLDRDQFQGLLDAYTETAEKSERVVLRRARSAARFPSGGEGPEHSALKERVAADPAGTLGEPGLRLFEREMPLPTADQIDVVLKDALGCYVAIEIEVDCSEAELVGPLQCMKYRAMLAYLTGRPTDEIRAILVAHSIHASVRARCAKYSVETKVVKRPR